jgi:hypothetical protein
MDAKPKPVEVSQQQLNEWAETCLRINHLGTLVQRELGASSTQRAADLAERSRVAAWELFNAMVRAGAEKPVGYSEPGAMNE